MLLLVELEGSFNNSGLIVGFSVVFSCCCISSLGASMVFGETFNPGIEI